MAGAWLSAARSQHGTDQDPFDVRPAARRARLQSPACQNETPGMSRRRSGRNRRCGRWRWGPPWLRSRVLENEPVEVAGAVDVVSCHETIVIDAHGDGCRGARDVQIGEVMLRIQLKGL